MNILWLEVQTQDVNNMSLIVGHLMAFFMKYLRRKAILLDKVP